MAFAIAACGGSSTTSVTAPSTNTRCQLNLTGSTTTFGPGGGSGTLNVGVSRECTWTATSQAEWISIVSGGDGQGDGTVSFRVAANADPVSRSGALQVSDQRMQLSQAAAPCSFDVSQPGAAPAPGGGRMAVDVRTHPACSWSATSDAPWISVAPSSGRGSATVAVTIAANTGSQRAASVSVAGVRFTITQPAPPPTPAPNPPPAPNPTPPTPTPTPTPDPTPTPTPEPEPEPDPGDVVNIKGKVESVMGICPLVVFDVKKTHVVTTLTTEYDRLSCESLRKGSDVEVEGVRLSRDSVRADKVTIKR